MPRLTGTLRRIAIHKLNLNPPYQRPVNEAWVRRKAKSFDSKSLGTIMVGRIADKNNELQVIDGKQRAALCLEVGLTEIDSKIETFATEADAAIRFCEINTQRRRVSAASEFSARIVAYDGTTIAALEVVHQHGFYLEGVEEPIKGRRAIGCTGTIARIARGPNLEQVLRIDVAAWPGSREALFDRVLMGLDGLLKRLSSRGIAVEEARLIRNLSRHLPNQWVKLPWKEVTDKMSYVHDEHLKDPAKRLMPV